MASAIIEKISLDDLPFGFTKTKPEPVCYKTAKSQPDKLIAVKKT